MREIDFSRTDERIGIDVHAVRGEKGDPGPAGAGLVAGGTTGQVLTKQSATDFDTDWADPDTGVTLTDPQVGEFVRYDGTNLVNATAGIVDVVGLQGELDAKAAAASTPAFIVKSGGSYPLRATVTSDAARVVIWIGDTEPTSGGGYAEPGVDVWWSTA